MLKKLLKSLLYFSLIILLGTFIITIFNYFSILEVNIIRGLKLSLPILSIFISSFILGRNSLKLGYLEGLKLGIIIVIIFLLITLISKSFTIKVLLYYLILILSSILGSVIGINLKRKE